MRSKNIRARPFIQNIRALNTTSGARLIMNLAYLNGSSRKNGDKYLIKTYTFLQLMKNPGIVLWLTVFLLICTFVRTAQLPIKPGRTVNFSSNESSYTDVDVS